MRCHTLINLINNFNDESIYLTHLLKPQKLINIARKRMEYTEVIEDMEEYLLKEFENLEVIKREYSSEDPKEIWNLISEYADETTILNISNGTTLEAALVTQIALERNIKIIYADLNSNELFQITKNGTISLNDTLEEVALEVEDFIEFTGGEIVTELTSQYNSDTYRQLLNFLLDHYNELWKPVRKILRNKKIVNIFVNQYRSYFYIKKKSLERSYFLLISKFINELKNLGIVYSVSENPHQINIAFSEKEVGYYLISGSWLEHLVYICLKEIQDIDDVHSGVRFKWDKEKILIENEIDVIATVDGKLICISCKDTSNYDSNTLNELDVYAKQLGGEDVIKVFISTEYNGSNSLIQRAKEMDIRVVFFDGDIKKLINQLRKIIVH